MAALSVTCTPAEEPGPPTVSPAPRSIAPGEGRFRITSETPVAPELAGVAERQLDALRRATGLPLPVVGDADAPSIRITHPPGLEAEGYVLRVTPGELAIEAATEAGVFYAFQTIRQLTSS